MKRLLAFLFLLNIIACRPTLVKNARPWQGKAQSIPGRIECELYNTGGEGIAYHDTDSINNGSGKLNPANGEYLHEFRMKEGVDISYTKSNQVDDNPFNQVKPLMDQLYVGWTMPGEWINYTIKAKETATYIIGLQYTSNAGGVIAFNIDGKPAASMLNIPTTFNANDTIAWRQWHHWNRIDSLTSIRVSKGLHVFTLKIIDKGNMNFDYLQFTKR